MKRKLLITFGLIAFVAGTLVVIASFANNFIDLGLPQKAAEGGYGLALIGVIVVTLAFLS